jgi:hypothetical protein
VHARTAPVHRAAVTSRDRLCARSIFQCVPYDNGLSGMLKPVCPSIDASGYGTCSGALHDDAGGRLLRAIRRGPLNFGAAGRRGRRASGRNICCTLMQSDMTCIAQAPRGCHAQSSAQLSRRSGCVQCNCALFALFYGYYRLSDTIYIYVGTSAYRRTTSIYKA